MFNTLVNADINSAFLNNLEELKVFGNRIKTRDMIVYEMSPHSFRIDNPTRRVLTCPYRFNNILATTAETLWVFCGCNDLGFLHHFLPNCFDYSDNGKTWRGAYGPRLRDYNIDNTWEEYRAPAWSISKFDQIAFCLKALKKDIYTRQAMIIIPIPQQDYNPDLTTRDRPCTIAVQFLYRFDKLHCFVHMRSNDAIWGAFNINVYEWTWIQEILAYLLQVDIGYYYHHSISFHYYGHKKNRVDRILNSKFKYNVYKDEEALFFFDNQKEELTLERVVYDLAYIYGKILDVISAKTIDKNYFLLDWPLIRNDLNYRKFTIFLELPLIQILINRKEYLTACDFLLNIFTVKSEYYIAAMEYLLRRAAKERHNNALFDKEYNEIFTKCRNFLLHGFSDKTRKFILGEWS